MLKLILSLLALIAGFIFTFLLPGWGGEAMVVGAIGNIAGALGVIDWRQNFELAKNWFKSVTIWAALMVLVPSILFAVLPMFSIIMAPWLIAVLSALIATGGGGVIIGIVKANVQNNKQIKNL